MTAAREDLGAKGNKARRKFWERCAANALSQGPPGQAAEEADAMLAEWDARWIAGEESEGDAEFTLMTLAAANALAEAVRQKDGEP